MDFSAPEPSFSAPEPAVDFPAPQSFSTPEPAVDFQPAQSFNTPETPSYSDNQWNQPALTNNDNNWGSSSSNDNNWGTDNNDQSWGGLGNFGNTDNTPTYTPEPEQQTQANPEPVAAPAEVQDTNSGNDASTETPSSQQDTTNNEWPTDWTSNNNNNQQDVTNSEPLPQSNDQVGQSTDNIQSADNTPTDNTRNTGSSVIDNTPQGQTDGQAQPGAAAPVEEPGVQGYQRCYLLLLPMLSIELPMPCIMLCVLHWKRESGCPGMFGKVICSEHIFLLLPCSAARAHPNRHRPTKHRDLQCPAIIRHNRRSTGDHQRSLRQQ